MRKRTFATFQALVLAILGFYLLDKIGADEIQFYINPRYIILVVLATLIIFTMAQRVLSNRPFEPALLARGAGVTPDVTHFDTRPVSRWRAAGLFLFLLPVLFDLVGQALPYQAREMAVSGINQALPASPESNHSNTTPDARSSDRSILDWVLLYQNSQGTDSLNGQRADVIGFVERPPGQKNGAFLIVRFVISNSAADLQPVGMQVDWPQSAKLTQGLWVRVQGVMASSSSGGILLPRLSANSVEPVPDPDQPYLFP